MISLTKNIHGKNKNNLKKQMNKITIYIKVIKKLLKK